MPGQQYKLILQAMPAESPPGVRLRRLLKIALRSLGFRCVEVEEVKDKAIEAAKAAVEAGFPVGWKLPDRPAERQL